MEYHIAEMIHSETCPFTHVACNHRIKDLISVDRCHSVLQNTLEILWKTPAMDSPSLIFFFKKWQ